MWLVDPQKMCNPEPDGNNHLLGEHNEIHKAYGGLLNHPYGEAIIEGQVDENNIDTTLMKERHDELAEEMERRGFDHNSSFKYEHDEHYGEGCIDEQQNRVDLSQRCEECEI